jgi:hypothetical protein
LLDSCNLSSFILTTIWLYEYYRYSANILIINNLESKQLTHSVILYIFLPDGSLVAVCLELGNIYLRYAIA